MNAFQITPSARRISPGQCGLTLVEVLVAVVILSLALLAFLTVMQASSQAVSDGNEFTLASQAAADQIAQSQGQGYSGLTSGTTTATVPGLSNSQMVVTVGPLDGNAANGSIKQVDIAVSWSPRKAGVSALTTSIKQTILISDRRR